MSAYTNHWRKFFYTKKGIKLELDSTHQSQGESVSDEKIAWEVLPNCLCFQCFFLPLQIHSGEKFIHRIAENRLKVDEFGYEEKVDRKMGSYLMNNIRVIHEISVNAETID